MKFSFLKPLNRLTITTETWWLEIGAPVVILGLHGITISGMGLFRLLYFPNKSFYFTLLGFSLVINHAKN